jgi:soluble lytic murein transglycosylase-like protein
MSCSPYRSFEKFSLRIGLFICMRFAVCLVLVTMGRLTYGQAKPAGDTVSKQASSITAMQASIDKQKAAVASQVGAGGPTDSFFSSPWTTPASITPPTLVAPCDAMQQSDLQPIVAEAATKQGLKPELIFAVIKRESASYPCAVSDKGALGLMQLMPDTAQQFGVDPLDAKQNVSAGSQYLKQLMTRYNGDLKLTLAAYNAGPQRVDTDKKVPDIPETTAYVDAILKDLNTTAPARK